MKLSKMLCLVTVLTADVRRDSGPTPADDMAPKPSLIVKLWSGLQASVTSVPLCSFPRLWDIDFQMK